MYVPRLSRISGLPRSTAGTRVLRARPAGGVLHRVLLIAEADAQYRKYTLVT